MAGPAQERLNIVICGGGIAGFATGLLLREDHNVLLLESTQSNEESGAAITLSINASRILRSSLSRAGFDHVKARYVEAEKFQELHWKNLSVLKEYRMATVTAKYEEPWWYFSRKDVHSEIKRAALSPDGLGAPVKVKLGAHVERVDPETTTVYLTSGETHTADIIIAADGIRTTTGNSVFGELRALKTGFSAYRCMIKTQSLREDPELAMFVDSAKVLVMLGPDRRVVIYPCSSWDYLNVVCIFPDDSDRRVQWTSGVELKEMLVQFKQFHPNVVKMLSLATETGLWQLRDRDPMESFVHKRVVLIGDAAHAMGPHQGQGACQAIEDAEALRVVLTGATRDSVQKRLEVFDQCRVPRVRTIIEDTRRAGPKRAGSIDISKQESTSANTDHHWSYKVTQETVQAMKANGFLIDVKDVRTGELVVGRQDVTDGSI